MVLKFVLKTFKSVPGWAESDRGVCGAEPPSSMAAVPKYYQLIFGTDQNGLIFGLERTGTNFLDRKFSVTDRTEVFWNGHDFGIC